MTKIKIVKKFERTSLLMHVKVLVIVSGFAYSGAEIVLDRYLSGNDIIDPYFVIIYNFQEVYNELIKRYDKKKIYKLDLKHKKNNLRFVPNLESIRLKKGLKEIINVLNPNIIFANNTIETMLVGLQSSYYNVPIIGYVHDMKSSIKTPIRVYYTKKALSNINKVITVSNACKQNWNNNNMKVIYNGLPKEFYNLNYRKSIQNIGFIGTLSYRKGFDIFLKIVDGILESNESINVYICYNKCENEELFNKLKILKMKYNERVKVSYKLFGNEIIEFYDKIDILVVPSRQDPLPTVIMEAIARGCLVIGSELDGIPELLNYKKEFMFKLDNILDIQNRLEYIINLNENMIQKFTEELFSSAENKFQNSVKKEVLNNEIISLLQPIRN